MNIVEFFSGIYFATFMAAGVFFLKFWKSSGDRFFLFFCLACWLISLERVFLFMVGGYQTETGPLSEVRSMVYLTRALAYVLILVAIVEKNRRSRRNR